MPDLLEHANINMKYLSTPDRRHRFASRSGAMIVDFAVTIPVLVLIVFAGIELGRGSMLRHTADHAAYVAARKAIIPGATAAETIEAGEDHLERIGIKDVVVSLSPTTITESTNLVEVQVSFPVASNSFVAPAFLTGTVSGRCRLLTERPPMTMSANLPKPPPPSN